MDEDRDYEEEWYDKEQLNREMWSRQLYCEDLLEEAEEEARVERVLAEIQATPRVLWPRNAEEEEQP